MDKLTVRIVVVCIAVALIAVIYSHAVALHPACWWFVSHLPTKSPNPFAVLGSPNPYDVLGHVPDELPSPSCRSASQVALFQTIAVLSIALGAIVVNERRRGSEPLSRPADH